MRHSPYDMTKTGRREFILLGIYSVLLPDAQANRLVTQHDNGSTLQKNGMQFRWHHATGRLHAELLAPTEGWLAVGFNERDTLAGTRFVIGRIEHGRPYAELHIAQPPAHRELSELGGEPDLRVAGGDSSDGVSRLRFSLPQSGTGAYALRLTPGVSVYLMLAWSQSPDFTHHSAMRVHLPLTL